MSEIKGYLHFSRQSTEQHDREFGGRRKRDVPRDNREMSGIKHNGVTHRVVQDTLELLDVSSQIL